MTYDDRLYGHPGQVQPAHLVITSPHFDARELTGGDRRDSREDYGSFATAPVDKIVELHEGGLSFEKVANELCLPRSSVISWYYRATGKTGRKG